MTSWTSYTVCTLVRRLRTVNFRSSQSGAWHSVHSWTIHQHRCGRTSGGANTPSWSSLMNVDGLTEWPTIYHRRQTAALCSTFDKLPCVSRRPEHNTLHGRIPLLKLMPCSFSFRSFCSDCFHHYHRHRYCFLNCLLNSFGRIDTEGWKNKLKTIKTIYTLCSKKVTPKFKSL